MSDITTQRPLDLIEAEINFYKAQTANGIIEIGKRLLEAKEQVAHGEWGKWLEEKVDFSQATANNFMRIANEFSNSESLQNLPYRKLFLLTTVPSEERETFMDKNNVNEMSSRQVEAAVKEWKLKAETAEQKAQKLDSEKSKLATELVMAKRIIDEKKDDIKFLQDEMKDLKEIKEKEIRDLGDQLELIRIKGGSSEDVSKLEEELAEARRQVDILTDELMKPSEISTAVVETIPEDIQKELDELRKFKETVSQQTVKSAEPQTATIKFKIHFDNLVKGFNDLLGILLEIKDSEPENHSKYSKAIDTLITKMHERL